MLWSVRLCARSSNARARGVSRGWEGPERRRLMGRGIGYVDVQLLAATRMAADDACVWTRDKRLAASARELDLAIDPALTDQS